MSKLKKIAKSPHIQIALATGFSIIIMAFISKKVLPEPIDSIPLAIPPLLMVIYEALLGRYKKSWFCKTRYWILTILLSTAIIIAIYSLK